MESFRNRRVTVMGLGRFGGGVGAVQFLASRGARVTVTDRAAASELSESLELIDGLPLEAVHLGGHREDDFRRADLVVVSPAIPRTSPFVQIALASGVPVTSEMNLFWQHNRGRTIGVTGSSGKSTTASMIHAILAAGGMPSRLGGNIGRSLLPLVDEIRPDDWCVLELSSFQLEELDALRPQPDVAVVTNFHPNHLDRHGSLAAYRRAKQALLRHQTPEQTAVLNAGDADVASWPTAARRRDFADDALPESPPRLQSAGVVALGSHAWSFPIELPGRHNRLNALAAAVAATAAGASPAAVEAGLRSFRPLPHRLELVAEIDGRRFFNDSKATTPEAGIVALHSFDRPVVLIAGGADKQVDLTAFAERIAARVRAVALVGETAGTLAARISAASSPADRPAVTTHDRFEDAFDRAVGQSQSGDVILLSPGCASYGLFRDYEGRGNRFKALVARLENSVAAADAVSERG